MQSFGPYTNLLEIGSGGMATVYRATAPSGNLVALKVIARHLTSDTTARRRFELESKLRLNHRAIVRVLDCGVLDGTPFMVTEYVVGESLERYMERSGAISPLRLAPILMDVASALDHAHARGIIHRDVKPSNILLRSDGQSLLADFGVAKSSGHTSFTATSARVGSVYYMSPEQAQGTLVVTQSTDIYSLGATAYHALCGRRPFEGDNDIAIARMLVDEKPRHVCDVNPQVPRSIGSVVMRALDKQPTRRWYSAGQFARAFERAVTRSMERRGRGARLGMATALATAFAMPLVAAMTIMAMMANPGAVGLFTPTPLPTARPMPTESGTPGLGQGDADPATPTGTVTLAPLLTPARRLTPSETDIAAPAITDTSEPVVNRARSGAGLQAPSVRATTSPTPAGGTATATAWVKAAVIPTSTPAAGTR